VTRRRMYVTGSIGSSAYAEAFTIDYDLPNDTAYAETCASIGLVFWASRKPAILADAAHAILTKPSRECTGNFFVDDALLQAEGITDLSGYAVDPNADLMPDFFI